MKLKIISTFCILATLSSFVLASPATVNERFTKATNDFASEIYQISVEGKAGNVIFSPVSIQSALTLVMFGAGGSTKEEMLTGLNYPAGFSNEDIAKNFEAFTKTVRESKSLKVANKVYVMKGFSVKKSFNDVATKSFDSQAQSIDFAQSDQSAKEINGWVVSNTNNKIKDLIKSQDLNSDTRMALVNAIYFKGVWAIPFEPKNTFKAPFYLNGKDSVEVDFMKIKEAFNHGYLRDLDANVIELPYEGSIVQVSKDYSYMDSDISMFIILPKVRTGLSALESKLKSIDLGSISKRLDASSITVEIPKFKIEFDIDLEKPLKKMGMSEMFSNGADFSNLLEQTQPLSVSKVIHKAFIEVNEKGTEATGATLGLSESRMARGPEFFTANHNFVFLINKGTTTLFMGRVTSFD